MHTISLATTLTIICLLVFLFSARVYEPCQRSVAQLPHGRMDPVKPFITEESECVAGPDFWNASRRIPGLLTRLRELTIVVRGLQHCHARGVVTTRDAAEVWKFAVYSAIYSGIALPEALLCATDDDLPHLAALAAAKFHWQATLRTRTLCQATGAPDWLQQPGALL